MTQLSNTTPQWDNAPDDLPIEDSDLCAQTPWTAPATTDIELPQPQPFEQRPAVRLGAPDFVVEMGNLRMALFSQEIESVEMVQYQCLVLVVNDAGEEVLYVGAETNPFDGPRKIFLGMFTPDRHVTVLNSPLLAQRSIVFMAACNLTRDTLGLSSEQAPLTRPEIEGFEMLEALANAEQPDWAKDSGSAQLIALICTESSRKQLAQL
jgi:hypothetical protein